MSLTPASMIVRLSKKPENLVCADCGSNLTKWAVLPHGIFICINCAGCHRRLGTQYSFVKSIDLDTWGMEQVKKMAIGNTLSNAYYEANITSTFRRPKPSDEQITREKFVRDKYVRKLWADKSHPPPVASQEMLDESLKQTTASKEPQHPIRPSQTVKAITLANSSSISEARAPRATLNPTFSSLLMFTDTSPEEAQQINSRATQLPESASEPTLPTATEASSAPIATNTAQMQPLPSTLPMSSAVASSPSPPQAVPQPSLQSQFFFGAPPQVQTTAQAPSGEMLFNTHPPPPPSQISLPPPAGIPEQKVLAPEPDLLLLDTNQAAVSGSSSLNIAAEMISQFQSVPPPGVLSAPIPGLKEFSYSENLGRTTVTKGNLTVAHYHRVIVRFNIGGSLFSTFMSTLERAPPTSLLFRLTDHIKSKGTVVTRRTVYVDGMNTLLGVRQSETVTVPHFPPFVAISGDLSESEGVFGSFEEAISSSESSAIFTSTFFLDRDPIVFRYILNHLRSTSQANSVSLGNVGVVACSADNIRSECDYYGLARIV
ncbi:Stromal Membrane Associated Protein C [Monocercomonoides exilis]|uniref:Stromal Membrane Associated Protein C n=1 Tax=Monocercomonoides exilis TaxID=2049356 RepID=UPI003559F781|nr:Stromal Membrane Associated Protein C [Monocercomonoides exilis]|eukprot:MONOS_7183.1-p1 / transcript=MONOS_7183.1 / gene=MONOS_7183 / organism=Monocercomonoides_exilis_PA203 / gene_product=Stromal Membrane Associated Protein C / transcript_product=Stromal Membrane Associated Protein C / location=Mono_scaffold00239:79427-81301(+) / protein_length=544 / sequence_SO=supercontig / SO=protein_coding / is_pseudo=false